MEKIRFDPWIGEKYHATKLLILSESAYSWEEHGRIKHPDSQHPKYQVLHWMENFDQQPYYRAIGRALSGKKTPTYDELWRAWNDCAYTIFVQGSVGSSPKSRPTKAQFKESGMVFLEMLEVLNPRPSKIVVTGKTMWGRMPDCNGPHLCDDLQAYKLSDGSFVWCLAVPHPANRTEGFQWEKVGKSIRKFVSAELPLRE
jgi:hypothetical protein